ncbi:probable glutamate receptor [Macrobrachium rosenbergii]|uniref:probable glutamate receptor n=1 Tax=Macrobrachium rosenbergii TaxID=79674 RepID=UPI0034D7955B
MRLINCAMLFWLSGASVYGGRDERKSLEVSLALSFAEFYHFQHISIVTDESKLQQGQNQGYDIWAARFLREVRTGYASVIPMQSNLPKTNGTTGMEHIHGGESPDLWLRRLYHSHLIVHEFYTAEHLHTFKKLFKGNEASADWLLLSDETFRDRLREVYLPLNSRVNVATLNTEDGGSAVLWEAYHVSPDFDLKEMKLGYWIHTREGDPPVTKGFALESFADLQKDASSMGLAPRYAESRHGYMYAMVGDAFSRRTNLMGLHLRCTTLQEEPFIVLVREKDGSQQVSGIVGSIFTHLQAIMNFTSTCYEVEDGAYGSLEDGQWNGLIGEVYNDEADIAVASIDVTKKRSLAVDFPIGVGYSKYIMYMKRPSNSDYMWRAYTKQFSLLVWIVTAVFILWVTILFYLNLKISQFPSPLVFSEASFTIIGFILGQGTSIPLERTAIRLIALTTLMTQVLLLVHYTSDLMSGLTAGPPLPRVSNLLDVASSSDLQLGYLKHISIDEYLRDSSIDAYRKIWEGIHERKLVDLASTNEDGFRRVLDNKNYVYMTADRAFLYRYSQECRVYLLPNANFPTQFTLALKKSSPLTPVFQKVLLKMLSSGLIDKWERDFTPTLADCNTLETSAIELPAVSVPLLLLGMGMVASLVIIASEIIVHRIKLPGS